MQKKSIKLLSELSRMKLLGGIIKENYNSDDDDVDWGDVAIDRRKEAVEKIEKEFGPQNQYSGSADWGGIPVWSVLGSRFEGYFIIDDSEFQPDNAFSLMKRTFNPETEENTDEIIFTTFLTPERYGDQGDGTIDELIAKAKEIKSSNLNENKENIEINAKLSTKQGIKNAIYKILEMNKIEGRYRDDSWDAVSRFKSVLEEVGAEVDLLRSNYEGHGEVTGYESMPTRKVYVYEISVRDKKGNMVTIPFKVTCAFVGKTGTMEDDVYELTYYTMA
jgi:hypothetical protein